MTTQALLALGTLALTACAGVPADPAPKATSEHNQGAIDDPHFFRRMIHGTKQTNPAPESPPSPSEEEEKEAGQ